MVELAKYNELQRLQGKVDYLTNEIFILELQKTKSTNDILILNRMIDEFQSSVAQKRGETTYMKQASGWYDNIISYCQNQLVGIRTIWGSVGDDCRRDHEDEVTLFCSASVFSIVTSRLKNMSSIQSARTLFFCIVGKFAR